MDSRDRRDSVAFKYVAGVVKITQKISFERQLFMTTRGNSYVLFKEVEDRADQFTFICFFLGEQLRTRIQRLCQAMQVPIHLTSEDEMDFKERVLELKQKSEDHGNTHRLTLNRLRQKMSEISKKVKDWKVQLIQEKSIRVVLNKFGHRRNMFQVEGWCPGNHMGDVEGALDRAVSGKGVVQP